LTMWCEEKVVGRGNSSRWFGRERPLGSSGGAPSGVPEASVFGWTPASPVGLSLSDRISDQDTMVVGRTRGQVLVDARTESGQVLRNRVGGWLRFFGAGIATGLEIPECLQGFGLVESGFRRHEGQEPGNRFRFGPFATTLKRRKAHESSGRDRPRFAAVRISAESNALKSRGIVTSWSSEQEHAMSETAGGSRHREVYGSAEG